MNFANTHYKFTVLRANAENSRCRISVCAFIAHSRTLPTCYKKKKLLINESKARLTMCNEYLYYRDKNKINRMCHGVQFFGFSSMKRGRVQLTKVDFEQVKQYKVIKKNRKTKNQS